MAFNPEKHHRRSTRLSSWDYSWPWWYYVTICTYDRRCLFGEIVDDKMQLNEIGEVVREEWMRTPIIRPESELDDFVIMPNHMHGIVIIDDSSKSGVGAIHESPLRRTVDQRRQMTLSKVIGRFKMNSAKRINLTRGTSGIPLWQRGFHDHIIRNDADLHRIRTYIAKNTLQWALDEENPDDFKSKQKVRI